MFIPRMPFCCKQQRQLKLRTCRRLVRLTGLLAGFCQQTTREERDDYFRDFEEPSQESYQL